MPESLEICGLFRECTPDELHAVAAACETVTARQGETIFEARSPAEHLYIVAAGTIELKFSVIHYMERQEIPIERKFKGDAFGWSAIVPPHSFTLSAVATRDSELVRISRAQIEHLCRSNHHFGYVFMQSIAEVVGRRFNVVQQMLIDNIQHSLKKKEPGAL